MADYLLLPVCARSVPGGQCEQDLVRPVVEHGHEEVERTLPGVQRVEAPLLAAQHPPGAVVVETGLPRPVPVHTVLVPLLPPGTQSWMHDFVEGMTSHCHDSAPLTLHPPPPTPPLLARCRAQSYLFDYVENVTKVIPILTLPAPRILLPDT